MGLLSCWTNPTSFSFILYPLPTWLNQLHDRFPDALLRFRAGCGVWCYSFLCPACRPFPLMYSYALTNLRTTEEFVVF
jgi:hypothetical protein